MRNGSMMVFTSASVPRLVRGGFKASGQQFDQVDPGAVRTFQLPKIGDVFRPVQPHPGKREEIQTVIGDVAGLFPAPLLGVQKVWREIVDGRADGGAALVADVPKVDRAAYLGDPEIGRASCRERV